MGTTVAEHAAVSIALLALSGLAVYAAVADEPEGDEETAACINAYAEAFGDDLATTACDDAGPFGFGLLATGLAFAALVVLYVRGPE